MAGLRHHRRAHPSGPAPQFRRTASLRPSRPPYLDCLLVGLGGLFAGVTGPLLSAFVPLLVEKTLHGQRTQIGLVMAIDNALLLLLVPLAGVASDRARDAGGSRLPVVLAGLVMAALGMAVFPWSASLGLTGVVAAMVVLYSGINVQRSPFQAMVADLIPSRYRSLATASVTFQMCVGAIVFLMLGRTLGMTRAFLVAAATILLIAAAITAGLRGADTADGTAPPEPTGRMLIDAARMAVGGGLPGMRAMFAAVWLLQLTFQTFTTWFALHGTERFGVAAEDVTLGFIAWALGGVVGALPAGVIGVRFGRRTAMLAGLLLLAFSLVVLDRVSTLTAAAPWLGLAAACWTLPAVNAFPLFVEPVPARQRGALAAMFLLSMALGGLIGDPLNGRLFDAAGSYRSLFLLMATYTALAFVAILLVPHGAGEADTAV